MPADVKRDDGVQTAESGEARRQGRRKVRGSRRQRLFQEVGDDFAVRLGLKGVTAFGELLPQLPEVLDNSVVNDGKVAGAIEMRMGVFLRHSTVGSPAGVTEA